MEATELAEHRSERGADEGDGLPFDPTHVVFSYDRESDTLMIHFYGRGLRGVSVHVQDGWYVRKDRDRQRVIGLQIEGFLARVVREDPWLLDALDLAELRGISLEEVARLRREMALERRERDKGAGLVEQFSPLWKLAAAV